MHHAGYYTLQSLKKSGVSDELQQAVYKDAVKIDTTDYHEISDFLFDMAAKINRETVKAVKMLPEFRQMGAKDERISAIQQLLQGLYDTFDEN